MHDAPQVPTLLPRLLISLGRKATALPAAWAVAAVAVGLAVAATADMAYGHVFSPLPAYLAIAGFAGWRFGERVGLLVAVAAVALTALVAEAPVDGRAAAWTGLLHVVAMLFLVASVVALRAAFEQQRWRATHDPLTGALNRAAFLDRLRIAATGIADGGVLLVACIDLDGFKSVNDQRGHAAGDMLLRDFVDGAAARLRRGDLVGRIGGDEFAMLLAVPPGGDGERHAARLQSRLAAVLAATGHEVTCSIGAVLVSAARSNDPAAIMAKADALMYEVKRRGKNDVGVAPLAPGADVFDEPARSRDAA